MVMGNVGTSSSKPTTHGRVDDDSIQTWSFALFLQLLTREFAPALGGEVNRLVDTWLVCSMPDLGMADVAR
jgi:hypothetical protein